MFDLAIMVGRVDDDFVPRHVHIFIHISCSRYIPLAMILFPLSLGTFLIAQSLRTPWGSP